MARLGHGRTDNEQPSNAATLVIVALVLALMGGFVADATLRANGLYGTRVLASEIVTGKIVKTGSRSSRHYTLQFNHAGSRLQATVLEEQYDEIHVGQAIRFVIVPGRLGTPYVFLDTPGFKLDPTARVVAFWFIIAVHFVALVGLFKLLLFRASRAEDERLAQSRSRCGQSWQG